MVQRQVNIMLFGKYIKEKKRLKKIEFEAYKQKKSDIAFAKEEEKETKRLQREMKARQRGRAKAECPLGICIDVKGTKRKARKATKKAGEIGVKASKVQEELGLMLFPSYGKR